MFWHGWVSASTELSCDASYRWEIRNLRKDRFRHKSEQGWCWVTWLLLKRDRSVTCPRASLTNHHVTHWSWIEQFGYWQTFGISFYWMPLVHIFFVKLFYYLNIRQLNPKRLNSFSGNKCRKGLFSQLPLKQHSKDYLSSCWEQLMHDADCTLAHCIPSLPRWTFVIRSQRRENIVYGLS